MTHSENINSYALQLLGSIPTISRWAPDEASSSVTGPSAPQTSAAPKDYAKTFSDVARAQALSILSDGEMHHTLYGAQQGRDILARIGKGIERAVVISPSHLKECGIGEYGRYLSGELAKQVENVQVVRTSSAAIELGEEFLNGALVVINHGPGLFDGLNPRLSQGESTTRLLQNLEMMRRDMGALPVIIHHSLLDTDHDLLFSRQSQIMNSEIPSLTFISSAGRHFFMPSLELGVSPVPVPKHRYHGNRDERQEVVGFFGFFQYGGKDFDSLFHLTREIRGRLVGSVATGNAEELERFNETLEELHLPHDFGSGWVEDTELLDRLRKADYFYLPQNDYDHWNNSATARFVTNLDRPLFLPPHHPFLDMADGSIFASKEDLPRIVAHFREPGHFKQAVDRVKKFRGRAAMSNTAKAIRNELAERQSDVGQQLLETAAACSAERMLELPEDKQKAFAKALSADAGALASFPSIWRAPDSRQYWRKHYELGDIVHSTLLESIYAIFFAVTKRPVTLVEILEIVTSFTDASNEKTLPVGKTLRSAFFLALKKRGGPFYDPEIVMLNNGEAVDWQKLLSAKSIETFYRAKLARRVKISERLKAEDLQEKRPAITNIAQLLTLPPEELRLRGAPIDLSGIDLDFVHAVRRPSQRLNRLVAKANDVSLLLGDHLVFDHLMPAEIEPNILTYVMEDFMYFSGDMFLLNAIRCIDKRNPYALEVSAFQSMMGMLGKVSVIQHLMLRAGGRVKITNFSTAKDFLDTEFEQFMHAARDPLFGLIEARNAYEISKRNNGRWWLRNKTEIEAQYADAGQRYELINLLYFTLTAPQDKRGQVKDPIWLMNKEGRFMPRTSDWNDAIKLVPNRELKVTKSLEAAFATATEGFHELEDNGVWSNGTECSIRLALDAPTFSEDSTLHCQLGFFGTLNFERPRIVKVGLWQKIDPDDADGPAGFEADPIVKCSHRVANDLPVSLGLNLPTGLDRGVYVLKIEIDGAISPKQTNLSEDSRLLGVRLDNLSILSADEPTARN